MSTTNNTSVNVVPGSKTLIQYIRHPKTNARIGVIVAYKEDNEVKIGWSVAHTKLDRFNKNIGLAIAKERARSGYMGEIPQFAIRSYEDMIHRAERYYKIKPVKHSLLSRLASLLV